MARRILVTATTFPRWRGDTEPGFVYELSKRLAEKFDVIVLAPHYKNARTFEQVGKLRVHRFRYFIPSLERLCYEGGILQNIKSKPFVRLLVPFFLIAEALATLRLARKYKVELIHAHWIMPQGFVAAIARKILGIHYIVTAHAGDIFPAKSPFLRWFAKQALKNAELCTANSTYTKNAVEGILKIKNLRVVPMGVNPDFFRRGKRNAKLRARIGIKGRMILSVGRLAEKKGIIYLIMAMPHVLKKYPTARLVIVGDGSEKLALIKKARELNITNSVVFAGTVKNHELPDYYASADVFVGPSIVTKNGDTEGLGIVFLEAMAAGTPAIGSNVGGIPDIIKHRKTGLLVGQKSPRDIADAVIEICSNGKLAKQFVARGQRHVRKNYSWSNVAERFYELVKRTLKKSTSS